MSFICSSILWLDSWSPSFYYIRLWSLNFIIYKLSFHLVRVSNFYWAHKNALTILFSYILTITLWIRYDCCTAFLDKLIYITYDSVWLHITGKTKMPVAYTDLKYIFLPSKRRIKECRPGSVMGLPSFIVLCKL